MNPLTPYLWLIKLAAAALLVAGVAFGVWLYGHKRYEAGISAQRAAESKSLAIYTRARDAQLASAEASYHAEIDNLRLHPVVLGPVRLREYVPGGSGADAVTCGTPKAAAAAGAVPNVSGPDHPVRRGENPPDISAMLLGLARRADRLSAQTRALIKAVK